MPPRDELVANLSATAAAEAPFAIGWHVALLFAGLALIGGWRPSPRLAARAVALLLPCPTLYAALGLAMIAGLGSRPWADALAAVALFYGVVGVVRVGVRFDLGLIAGALMLITLRYVYRLGNGPRHA